MDSPDEDEIFAKYAEAKRKSKVVKKFLSFNERIEQMGGDNGRFSRKINTETSYETYFEDSLETWRAQDQGPDLESFIIAIQSKDINTYAQLLHKADVIFDALIEHFLRPDSRSIPAFCNILSSLARDLRDKFNKYCWRSFEVLINILDIGERIPENVEAAYLCLTILVKVQAATLAKQLKKTFVQFLPLFASSRGFVRRFAAESYAYLMRKSSDLRGISMYIVKQAYKTPHNYLSDGCALLFHTTYIGIAGTFNSNCSQYLRDILSSFVALKKDEFKEFCIKILVQMIGYTIEYANKSTYPNRFFYQHVLTKLLGESKSISEASSLMRVLHPCIVSSDDEFLNEVNRKKKKKEKANKRNKGSNELKKSEKVVFECSEELKTALQNVVQCGDFELDPHVVGFVSETLLTIFNDDKNRLFSKDITLSIVEKSKDYESIIGMLLKLIHLDSFDLYLMPSLGRIASDIVKNSSSNVNLLRKVTSFYAYLCSQRRPIRETIGRTSRSNFFDLSHHYCYRDWLIQNIESYLDDNEFLLDMLLSWPWLFAQTKNVEGTEAIVKIIEKYMKSEDTSILNSQVVLAGVAGIYLTNKDLLKTVKMELVEEFIKNHSCCESSLLTFELLVKVLGVSKNVEYMNRVAELLYPAFLNSNDNVRKTALQILTIFKLNMKSITDEEGNIRSQTKSVFDVLFEAESSELTNFRQRLLHFRKLRHGQHEEYIPEGSSETVEKIVLTDLVSQFFVNFTPLWKGVQELLKEYAQDMNIDKFWGVMGQWIENVNKHIRQGSPAADSEKKGRLIGVDTTNRSDFVNARIQLYNFFESIPDVAERRTRILSPLLLGLFEDFNRLTSSTSKIENIIQDEDGEDNDNEEESEHEEPEKRAEIAHVLKALNSLLVVYSKFNAAKATYLEPKLLEMYEKLLATKYEGLQKSALACICSYRNSILAQYRENLENLIDEDKLRQTLLYFKLSDDEDDVQVIDEHRSVVVPILLRILHGKLMTNPKKKGTISRRNGIIYVIGGCRSDELTFFLKLYFSQVYSVFGSNASFADIENICQKENFIPNVNLRVFLGVLTGVSEMIKKIARSMTENEQKMVMYVTLACGIVSKYATKTMPNLEVVKTLRMSVCDRLAELFHAFPDRQLLCEEVQLLKDTIISSHLIDLPKSTVIERNDMTCLPVAPFAVVKLAAAICKLPTLYQMLTINLEWNVSGEGNKRSCDIIDLLLAPLLWPGCFDLMFRTIRTAMIKLSELADEDLVDIKQFVSCSDVQLFKKTNYGTSLLRSRVRFVLDFLTMQIEKEVTSIKRPSSESITLLERFSDFVSEFEDIPNRLATPLLMCIERLKCNEETMVNMLKSMARISPILNEPEQYFGKLPKLFSKMEGRTLRDGLVEMVQGFSKSKNIDEKTSKLLQLICDLDSWDKSKVDEPNFDKRYAAYHALMDIWTAKEAIKIDPIILGMFVGTHFQCISTTTDLSLRMTAGNNVRALVEFSGRSFEGNEKRTFLDSFLSPTVIFFMKHDVDAVREEALSTLGVMVRSFKENQHLAELREFTNDEDEEVDFLKNMNHIQIHRRQKAIRKLIDNVESGEKNISFNAMFKYLIPMINPYLINFSAKFNAISDESLQLLRLTMSKAPWGKYCSYLESWLARIEKATGSSSSSSADDQFTDKALVRIVVAVIDAFHFDVHSVEEDDYTEQLNDQKNEEEEKAEVVLQRINRVILPRLAKCLDSQTHAVERKARTVETQATALHLDIQRAPIAFAIVKLLQKLPDSVIGKHLHGVILKICNLMMTKSFDVRETARKTLLQIVKCLGSKYLASIITEISLTMTKGFQVHVAIYSIHTLIVAMKGALQNGELDSAINVIVKLCIQDQFSTASEEKEIGSIKAECPEAKGNRTPETMMHLGKFVSPAGIQMVLDPFRSVVNENPSAKAIQKVSDLLSKFASGLKDNEGLDNAQLLTYIYKSLSSDLQKLGDVESKNEEKTKIGRRPESCLILPAAPQRIGAMTKVVIRSRDHVFAEFFVHLFAALLKEKKLDLDEEGMMARLNPFVTLILNCFDYKYEKLISGSLRSLCSMIKIQLPAISANSQRVSDTLFILLSDYASIGQAGSKPEIVKLNQLIYKGFTNLINISGCEFLDNDKLTLLLAYSEADVMDQHKQATMFSLIKILVKKGVRHERLAEIMDHLAETSIRSPLVSIRAQCRETLLDYIGGASDSDKSVEKFIEFFLDQLDYEYETGRQSAAEMMCALFRNLLPKSLESIHMLCVVKLGAAIMNDESPKVSAQVGIALRNLLSNVGVAQRNETFEVILQWLETEDENARAVAIQTTVQLSFVEKDKMIPKVGKIFENLQKILFDESLFENSSETTIVSMLNGITRILANVGKSAVEQFDAIRFLESLEELAKCEDSITVMCAASTLIGQILSSVDMEKITEDLAKEISLWMCRALRHSNLDIPTGEQASKNLVCLARRTDIESYKLIVANIAQSCRYEVKHQVKQVVKRISCFKLIAALFVTGDGERAEAILEKFMTIFVRELRTCKDEDLSNLTQEVCALIKKKIGDEDYSRRVAECQKSASDKITDRKRKIRELAVTAPEDSAELRRKKNKKKTETRKRKLDEMKPYRMMKRKHAESRKLHENEED